MIITTPEIERYMASLLPQRSQVLKELEEVAAERDFPIVGPLVGTVLSQLSAMIGARRIMELGSGFGYSALWFAQMLPSDGRIVCTDLDDANRQFAEEAFRKAGMQDLLEFHTGEALDVLAGIEGEFDVIFCDIDKSDYSRAFRMALSRLRPGGVLVFDNALWKGRMLEGDMSEATRGIVELNHMAFTEDSCYSSIIPLRDGLLLCWKRS